MTSYGFKLMSELHGAGALVEQAIRAEAAGFGFVAISDHYHPWLPEHHHSPFAWSVLGAIAARTSSIELATGVTCPIGRYHPAVVAQAAATVASMSQQPFTLAVGSGERLNEHVTGQPFPAIDVRHEMLAEAIRIIRELWTGAWTTVRGQHFTVEDARIYDLPEEPIKLAVAVSGPASLEVARSVGADGIMATDPDRGLTEGWVSGGGDPTATWAEVPFAHARTDEEGLRLAHERFRFGATGWKVQSELPNPVNFAAACEHVRPEDLAESVPHGPDPQRYVDAIDRYRDAGFERIAIIPVGDDVEGLLRLWRDEVLPALG